jgi:RNA polymerase sigma-70 factor, ECF subfamily
VQPGRDDRRDRELLARLAAGESDALGELYDRHALSLYRHARALARCRDEADDLVQVTFVKLATTGAPLLGVRNPASYLHRILWTSWIDEQRGRAAKSEQPLETAVASGHMRSDPGASQDGRLDVERALTVLPDAQREAVILHIVLGFSLRETGRITGVSTFTAASRYRLAMERMRKTLEGR